MAKDNHHHYLTAWPRAIRSANFYAMRTANRLETERILQECIKHAMYFWRRDVTTAHRWYNFVPELFHWCSKSTKLVVSVATATE